MRRFEISPSTQQSEYSRSIATAPPRPAPAPSRRAAPEAKLEPELVAEHPLASVYRDELAELLQGGGSLRQRLKRPIRKKRSDSTTLSRIDVASGK